MDGETEIDEMGTSDADAQELLRLREQKRDVNGHRQEEDAERKNRVLYAGGVEISYMAWAVFSVVGGLIYGYNVSLAAALQYIRDDLSLSPTQQESLSATATFSDAISMLVGGRVADKFGRKKSAMVACLFSIVGSCTSSLLGEYGYGYLLAGRLLVGVGNGLCILLIPMYISECVEASVRGNLLTHFQLGVNFGCSLPYLFMLVVSERWRLCLGVGCVPAIYIFHCFLTRFPESVKWTKWKSDGTNITLEDISIKSMNQVSDVEKEGYDSDSMDEEDTSGTDSIDKSSTAQMQSNTSSRRRTIHSARPRPKVELLVGMLMAYVNNCIDPSIFYGPTIVSSAFESYTKKDANVFGLACSLVAVASVLLAAHYLIDSFSRRRLYLICLFAVCICFFCSGVLLSELSVVDGEDKEVKAVGILFVFALLNAFAAVGPSILFVVILAELFQDSSYRARYMSYCTFAMSLISLLVNGTLLSLFQAVGTPQTFFLYGATYVVCFAVFWKHLPETKLRQLV